MENRSEIVVYQTRNGALELRGDSSADTIWASLDQIAKLFGRDKSVISRHIRNIYHDGELIQSSVVAFFATTASDGKTYNVEYFNLAMILSVGYRVNSVSATKFRQWATQELKKHIVDGYTINKDRLGNVENLYRYMKDTLTVTSMNINRLRIDSARQKDLAVLAEDIDTIKQELDAIKKKLK